MFLEKYSRFVRHYRFSFAARHKAGVALPLFGQGAQPSVKAAIEAAIATGRAYDKRPNGDVIEVLSAKRHAPTDSLVLLMHKASPNAADPMYRKKYGAEYKVRTVDREADEDQSVSAHLIILPETIAPGTYDAILEEIPGLSMSAVQASITNCLRDYEYDYTDRRGKVHSTYSTFKPSGVKSETMTEALKAGKLSTITLSRPADSSFIDDDAFRPRDQRMTIKIEGRIEPSKWTDRIGSLARRAREAGWEDFLVDIELDDERSRRVPIARGEEAKEVLFVRSKEITVENALPVCSIQPSKELVANAIKAIRG